MLSTIGKRSVVGGLGPLLPAAALMLGVEAALVATAVAAKPTDRVGDVLEMSAAAKEVKKARTELTHLAKEAPKLAATGRLTEAIAATERATFLARGLNGEKPETVGAWLDLLASLHERREDWQAALRVRQEVLVIRGKVYGESNWRVTDARLKLKDIDLREHLSPAARAELKKVDAYDKDRDRLFRESRYKDAIVPAEQALAICRKLLGREHPRTATSLHWLALLHNDLGDSAKAEPLYLEALETRKTVLGIDHPDTATTINNLAVLYNERKDYAKAEPLYLQALELNKKAWGKQHTKSAFSLRNLGLHYKKRGDHDKAEPLLLQAWEMRAKLLGMGHADAQSSFEDLESLYKAKVSQGIQTGNYASAKRAQEAYAQLLGRRYGESNWRVTDARLKLKDIDLRKRLSPEARAELKKAEDRNSEARSLRRENRSHDALPLAQDLLTIRRNILGTDHPATADSLNLLGLLHFDQGQYGKAEAYFKDAIDVRQKILGEDHPDTALSCCNLGFACNGIEQYERADQLFERALSIDKRVYGELDGEYIADLKKIAASYRARQHVKAEPLLRELLRICKARHGEAHSETIAAFNELQNLYDEWSESWFQDAKVLAEKRLALKRERYGDTHDKVAHEWLVLARVHEHADDFVAATQAHQARLSILAKLHGAESEQALDAALALDHSRRLAAMTPVERQQLTQGEKLDKEARAQLKTAATSQALATAQHVLKIRRALLGAQDPFVGKTLSLLGDIHLQMGQLMESAQTFGEALQIYERSLGRRSGLYAEALTNLATLYQRTNDYPKIEQYYLRALPTGRRDVYGARFADLFRVQAGQEEDQGNLAAARTARKRVAEIMTSVHGAQHWKTLEARVALSRTEVVCRLTAAERRQLEKGKELLRKAQKLFKQEQWGAALRLCREATDLTRNTIGERSQDYLECLFARGAGFCGLGDLDNAERDVGQAAEVYKLLGLTRHPDYARCLLNYGLLRMQRGVSGPSQSFVEEASRISKETAGEDSPLYWECLSSLASVYRRVGRYRDAIRVLEDVLAHQRKPLDAEYSAMGQGGLISPAMRAQLLAGKHAEYLHNLERLAVAYLEVHEYSSAGHLLRNILEIEQESPQRDNDVYRSALAALAWLESSIGSYATAERLFDEVLNRKPQQKREKREEPDPGVLNAFGRHYYNADDYAKAEELLKKALTIMEKTGRADTELYGLASDNLALVYVARGEYAKAEPLFTKAIDLKKRWLSDQHKQYAVSLNNLAELHQARGEFAKAAPLFEKALRIHKRLGQRDPEYTLTLRELGKLAWQQGEITKAEPLLRQALEATQDNLTAAASTQSEREQLAMASTLREYLDAYLTLSLENREHGSEVTAKLESFPARRVKEPPKSGDPTKTKIVGPTDDRIYRYVLTWKGSVLLRERRMRLLRASVDKPDDVSSGGEIMRISKAQDGQVQLWMRPNAARFADLESVTSRLAALRLSGDSIQSVDVRRKIEALTELKDNLEIELARKDPQSGEHAAPLSVTPDQVREILPHDAVLIDILEYEHSIPSTSKKGQWTDERRVAAFLLNRDRPIEWVELGSAAELSELVDAFVAPISKGSKVDNQKAGPELRRLVWEPIAKRSSNAKIVLISPDGALTRLPFGALPGKAPGKYLIEETSIAIVPVPQILPELLRDQGCTATVQNVTESGGGSGLAKASAALVKTTVPPGPTMQRPIPTTEEPSLLLVGGVDFNAVPHSGGKRAGNLLASEQPALAHMAERKAAVVAKRSTFRGAIRSWDELEGSRVEIETIKQSFSTRFPKARVTVLSKDAPTEEAVRREAPNYRFLHFATHGFLPPQWATTSLARSKRTSQLAARGASDERMNDIHPGLLSGLALTGANQQYSGGQYDNILTALEIESLKLSGVDLVTLSACNTALGTVAGGEGVLGLQRAFQTAGAKACVTSLWSVDDAATQVLMTELYTNLWQKKLGKLDALRQAQLRMLREYEPQQKRFVPRGLDIPADHAAGPERGSPFYWVSWGAQNRPVRGA